jgi:hypothetical protein
MTRNTILDQQKRSGHLLSSRLVSELGFVHHTDRPKSEWNFPFPPWQRRQLNMSGGGNPGISEADIETVIFSFKNMSNDPNTAAFAKKDNTSKSSESHKIETKIETGLKHQFKNARSSLPS